MPDSSDDLYDTEYQRHPNLQHGGHQDRNVHKVDEQGGNVGENEGV